MSDRFIKRTCVAAKYGLSGIPQTKLGEKMIRCSICGNKEVVSLRTVWEHVGQTFTRLDFRCDKCKRVDLDGER